MYRIILIITLVLCEFVGVAQPYNNEWIDPAKTYFKFPVRTSQLCRIPKATLVSYGLGDVPAEQFQLWRDGQEVPVYTTEATGPISTTGYIEFFGKQNDGLKDSVLYPQKWFQPNTTRSLFNDTSWYFLTVNTIGNNQRLVQTANNVASTTLAADSFFNFKGEMLFPQGFNEGYCINYQFDPEIPSSGTQLRLSIFDRGEGWYYSEFRKTAPGTVTLNNLRVYPKSSTGISVEYKASGFKGWTRNALLYMNDSLLSTNLIPSFEMINPVINNIPLSRISGFNSTSFKFSTDLDDKFYWDPDRNFLHSIVMSYQRTFNLNNAPQYELRLSPNLNGNHLKISNFGNGGLPVVLYDYTNNKRYLSVNKPDTSMFLLEPSALERRVAIITQSPSQINTVNSLKQINFPDLTQLFNQGDYLIISSKLLTDYNGTNFVEAYRAYRSSFLGGSYNAKYYDVDELADMFAFGIRKHPFAVKNFIRYAHDQFANKPKFVFLIGHGSRYIDYKVTNYALKDWLNAVPTYGMPASDNLLASNDFIDPTPLIPIGRLSAINGQEINDYLTKVKELEALDKFSASTLANKDWKKKSVQLIGGDDAYLSSVIGNFMQIYKNILCDTLVLGGESNIYTRVNNKRFAEDLNEITGRINEGVGLINYFGHSSASSIDFALSSPFEFDNTGGKYPVFIANGCKAGNIFDFNGNRINYYGQSISDNFIFAKKRGAIAFISNSDFGIINYMHLFNSQWHMAAAKTKIGKSIGEIQQAAIGNALAITSFTDFFNRQNCEQVILHADPAIVLYPFTKPDYFVVDSFVSIVPAPISTCQDSLLINVLFHNIGTSIKDSVIVEVQRRYPDGRSELVYKNMVAVTERIKSVDPRLPIRDSIISTRISDTLTLKIPTKVQLAAGTNQLIVTVDPDNLLDESNELNNTAEVSFEVSDEEIRPVYPYPFAIVNQPGFLLTGSTLNPIKEERTYRLQIDTTENFNSPLLFQKDTVSLGGAVSFNPSINWTNNRVYYWRLAPVINGQPVNWRSSSFQYLQGTYPGWGQSHFFQHQKSNYVETSLGQDGITRFADNVQSLYLINSIYGFSGGEDTHFSITVNGVQSIRSACVGRSIIFNVFDTLSFKPWENWSGYRFGSGPNCNYYREYNFEFSYVGSTERKKMMDFLDSIPKGLYVTARMILAGDYYANNTTYFDSSFVKYWQRDTLVFGPGKSLYHSLLRQGFYTIDSVNNQPRTFIFVFKKDDSTSFKPQSRVSQGLLDRIYSSVFPRTVDTAGAIISPAFGPAKEWTQMQWMGHQFPGINPASEASVQLIGIDKDSNETVLKTFVPSQWTNDISDISAAQYPYLKLKLQTKNAVKAMPYQLDYWRLFYEPVPDGALSARDRFVFQSPILLTAKDSLKIELAFKNISRTFLDSTRAVLKLGDRDGIIATYDLGKLKPLQPQDTAIITFKKATNGMSGKYYALIEVNKEQNPLEQYSFNNFAYLPFEVVTALPNTLVDFNARASQKNSVLLHWKATNETDVQSYVLEHGASVAELKFLHQSTAINSGGDALYNWEHLSPVIGKNFYRLKITTQSGKVEYSPVRQVNFGRNILITAYPNPFSNRVFIQANSNDSWTAELFNAAGQKIMLKTGSGNQFINTNNLPPGRYLLRLTIAGETTTVKLEKNQQ